MNFPAQKHDQFGLNLSARLLFIAGSAYAQSRSFIHSGGMVKHKSSASVPPPPPAQSGGVGKPRTPRNAAVEATLKMPNERDESLDMTPDAPDPVIEQAAVDVARGLQDTSKGAELNRAYKKLK